MNCKLGQKLLLTADNAEKLVKDRRVLLRVDFNVPLDSEGQISSDLRIRSALGTIELLLKFSKCIVMVSHMGRPNGKRDEKSSLKIVALHLSELLNKEVKFIENPFGSNPDPIDTSGKWPLILLENLRFYPEEEASPENSDKQSIDAFADKLAQLADIYVNDAFGTAHRAHASMVAVAKRFQIRAAGLLMAQELRNFSKVLENPQRPVLCIIGGAKVVDKIALLDNLLEKCDNMIICGGMAFTFLKVLNNLKIGKSLFDENSIDDVRKIATKANKLNKNLILPNDFIASSSFDEDDETFEISGDIPDDLIALDCGLKSRERFAKVIEKSKTILWNGPPGVFEKSKFEGGSISMLNAICSNKNAFKVAGGGDTTSLVMKHKCDHNFDLVSTGGGASLELMEGKILPGIAALSDIK